MLLLEKKAKCPLCGAKNPIDAARCAICTRPLEKDPLPSQAVYQEALWSTRIASKGSRKKANPYAVLGMLVVLAVILNYFVIGFGPNWAHEPKPQAKGSQWKEYRQADYVADLPGDPIPGTADAVGTHLSTSTVWIDGHWDLVRDDDTQSVGAIEAARAHVYAGLVTAVGNAPTDAAASLPALVTALVPDTELAPGGVATVQDATFGQQITLDTTFSGFPEAADEGTVRATATVVDGKIFVAASFVVGGDDAALHRRLADRFIPAGAPAH